MRRALLIQLPIPQNSFGRQTGNIPLAGACLRQAAAHLKGTDIRIMPESVASYLGDAAILQRVLEQRPALVGFSTYAWNVRRVLRLARLLKESYAPVIVIGGPEVTPDNPMINDPHIDHRIYGSGETAFVKLLQEADLLENGALVPQDNFQDRSSPYLTIPLEHEIEGMMLLETTRGCPYRCAYCYYNKASRSLVFKKQRHVLEGLAWARDHAVEEIYFLDPSLNVRPDLRHLLGKVASCNTDHRLVLNSELRAESVDAELAGLLAAAGFKRLEIGLQTINPAALKFMRRPTDLKRFAEGVRHLKRNGIICRIDLIVGLPGDTPEGFDQTVRFVRDNHFEDDLQVFPLSLLPGTEFRRRSNSLGLSYDPEPPYLVSSTPGFTPAGMVSAFERAEEAFDLALYPRPDLDVSWKLPGCTSLRNARDITVCIGRQSYAYKIILHPHRTPAELRDLAARVTHPYQIVVPPGMADITLQSESIALFSDLNPHTPFEVIFFDPQHRPDVERLLHSIHLQRPHYLDNHLRFAEAEAANRAVLFTVVSDTAASFGSSALRLIFWWRSESLPDMNILRTLERDGFEGILLDPAHTRGIAVWQDRMAPAADELMLISFAQLDLQRRWIELTARDRYYPAILPG